MTLDHPARNPFYVVLKNISRHSIRLNLADSEWYNCLEFQITATNGKTFSIHRPLSQLWAANSIASWIFQPDGMRILTVDFTSGRWEGLPSETDLPRKSPFKIKATFEYRSRDEKGTIMKYDSEAIDAVPGRPGA
jgi:hypothetical protein